MIAKFIGLLVLLFILAGLVYVAITDVTVPQTERIVKVNTETAAPAKVEATTEAETQTESTAP